MGERARQNISRRKELISGALASLALMEQDPPPQGEATLGPTHISVVRVVDRTTHVSARARVREIEYQIRNGSGEDFIVLYLPLPRFAVNLRLFDEDGRRLNFYSNAEVKTILAELKAENPEAHERFEQRFKHAEYRLLVMFPQGNPLHANSMRTVRLEFENSDPVSFKRWTLFSQPSFSARDTRFPGHGHEHFFIVVGLPEYAICWKHTATGKVDQNKIHVNGENGKGRVLSIRFPPANDSPYNWEIDYTLVPARTATATLLGAFFLFATIGGIALLTSPFVLLGTDWEFTDAARRIGVALTGGLAATTLAVGFNLADHWTERFKLLLALPFLLNAVAWFAWSFV